MITHTVLFRLRPELPEVERSEAMQRFRDGILGLDRNALRCLSVHVGFNANPSESWDICLTATFADMADLAHYAAHPDHVCVAAALKPLLAGRACVDSVS
ncbi:MAG: Dabb family protein [Prevotellaceae bacterium]|nr:Dabb family protein [Prevotellaceae bacterium]